MNTTLHPILVFYWGLANLITRGVADRDDSHVLAKSVTDGDFRLWQSEREGGCELNGQVLATDPETHLLSQASSRVSSEPDISFFPTVDEAKTQLQEFDIMHVSSSFQNTSDPQRILQSSLETVSDYVLVEKLVLAGRKTSIGFSQYSLLGANVPEAPRQVELWIKAVIHALAAIPIYVFFASLGKDFELVKHTVDPVQYHLPIFRGLYEHTFQVKRGGV